MNKKINKKPRRVKTLKAAIFFYLLSKIIIENYI